MTVNLSKGDWRFVSTSLAELSDLYMSALGDLPSEVEASEKMQRLADYIVDKVAGEED